MYRKLFLIFLLALGLVAVLILKPWQSAEEAPPRIFDRLPEADIIGISNVLELSGSLSKTMYYYKIPFRDVISPGFILSQGKTYGLDVQAPVFFFMNEHENELEDWGIIVSVRDSSKVRSGLEHLQKFTSVKRKNQQKIPIYYLAEYDVRLVYGNDWIMIYHGDDFQRTLNRVLNARYNDVSPRWREFVNKYNNTSDLRLVASIESDEFREMGIESAGISMNNDSTGLIFAAYIRQLDSLSFQMKTVGPSYTLQEYTRFAVNLHMNVDRLKRHPNDPVYKLMKKYSMKVSFPLDHFLRTWEGDIAFREGGFETVKESYIESELDENFNISEVVKSRDVRVPGFSLYISTNDYCPTFMQILRNKGILTTSDDKHRLLFSPPLTIQQSDSSLVFHSSKIQRGLINDTLNQVLWSINYTPIEFMVDSTTVRTVYGKIRLPLRKIVKDNIPTDD